MAAPVKIDFDTLYEIDQISPDLKYACFQTILQNGQAVPLVVKISNQSHELLPDVYNLAFGPLNKKGKIDDKAEISHKDYSKVFSTILFRISKEDKVSQDSMFNYFIFNLQS